LSIEIGQQMMDLRPASSDGAQRRDALDIHVEAIAQHGKLRPQLVARLCDGPVVHRAIGNRRGMATAALA
jgi:hypothetical protein